MCLFLRDGWGGGAAAADAKSEHFQFFNFKFSVFEMSGADAKSEDLFLKWTWTVSIQKLDDVRFH